MWWSDRLPMAMLCMVAACGFTPAYGPDAPAAALRNAVTVEAGETVLDYRLRVALEDRLGTGPDYVLSFSTQMQELQAAVTQEGKITRFNVTGVADWVLRDTAGAEVVQGQARGFTSYLTTGSTVATDAASRDAASRLAAVLADQIVAQLLMTPGAG